ncbi:RNA-BINDING (RRM/RBD/RNP MOTIFS) FAMILY PROTEIN [Salix koriyanagi]|uniref:RNA-BINDING (RRM/RBD/RNP MOTIFS) FAMILY PROTEIN n=1 Tax=Salix koriyanagi TaxID=2511006 RepID=A0A9Q0WN04_9ROSI|nr:RNA-BINDING (RRM/RBD/RNP MOTIFS) FAMILY PROTEIN [Salix koriyanagi]
MLIPKWMILSFEETVSDIDESDDLDEELEDENVESVSKSDPSSYDSSEPRMEAATASLSSKKQHKKQASKKKIVAKGGGKKVLKLDIPGSAKRLKIKEKAVLTDVFAKYGLKTPTASAKES